MRDHLITLLVGMSLGFCLCMVFVVPRAEEKGADETQQLWIDTLDQYGLCLNTTDI